MKILITGGLGYVAYALIEKISPSLNPKDLIVIYDNNYRNEFSILNNKNIRGENFKYVKGDILDNRSLKEQVIDSDIIVHLAAIVTTPFEDKFFHHFDQINHWGTANIVSIVEECPRVKQFIYLSTLSVYGSSKKIINEASDVNPDSSYAISKYEAEKHVMRLSGKVATQIIRAGNVYGHNNAIRLDSVINQFMYQAHFEEKISINGNGKQSRGFISLNELSELIVKLIYAKNKFHGIQIAVSRSMTVDYILKAILEIYPSTEFLFRNENLKMKSIQAQSPSKGLIDMEVSIGNFHQDLLEFKEALIER